MSGFTKRYGIDRLVWFEVHDLAETALRREKQIKEWKRDSKINLIEQKPTLDRSLSALDDLIADCLMILAKLLILTRLSQATARRADRPKGGHQAEVRDC